MRSINYGNALTWIKQVEHHFVFEYSTLPNDTRVLEYPSQCLVLTDDA